MASDPATVTKLYEQLPLEDMQQVAESYTSWYVESVTRTLDERTAALRAELMLIYVGAQRHAIALRIAHVDPSFDFPSRGPFDGKYMQALYEVGVAAGKKGTAFGDTLPDLSMRGSSSQQ